MTAITFASSTLSHTVAAARPRITADQLQTAAAVLIATVTAAFVLSLLAQVQAGF